jgi:hypothetical protein
MKEDTTGNRRQVSAGDVPATRPENTDAGGPRPDLVADLSTASLFAFAISILLLALAVATASERRQERKAGAEAGYGSARDDARREPAA